MSDGRNSFIIDDADYRAVAQVGPWHLRTNGKITKTYYAQRHCMRFDGVETTQQLHTFLTGWSLVDHINTNGLDNRRENLRPATRSQNNANARGHANGTSPYKGVSWKTRRGIWVAQIGVAGIPKKKTHHLGCFEDPTEAARAYDSAALALYGEFARLNFPQEIAS